MWLSEKEFECPQYLLDKTRSLPRSRVAVVNAQSAPVMESISQAVAEDLIDPILIGELESMRSAAKQANLDIANFEQIEAASEHSAVEAATALINQSKADFVMKGHIHTDEFLRGLLNKETGIRGEGFMTHVFHMTVPGSNKPLFITDAAIHVEPNEKAMKSIVRNVVSLAHDLGIDQPKVALLSASETVNEAVPSSINAQQISQWAKQELENLHICGPLAFDVAISQRAASIKAVTDPVAGQADIIVVPQLETGNALFKTLVYFKSACAAGIAMGAKVPVVLTSRADPPEARLASIAIASILCAKHC